MATSFQYPNVYWEMTAAVFDMALCIFLALQYRDTSRQNRRFRSFMYVVTACTFIDVLSVLFTRGQWMMEFPPVFYHIVTTISHASSGFVAFYFALYVQSYANRDRKRVLLYQIENALFHIYLVAWVIHLFIPYLFEYEPKTMIYHMSPIFYVISYGIPFFHILCAGHTLLRWYQSVIRRVRYTMYFLYFLMWFCALLQAIYPGRTLITFYMASMGLFLSFLLIETPSYRRLLDYKSKLEVAEREAIEANSQKTDFLAAMSHEIRTPLAGVLGTDDLILRATKDPQVREYAENIYSAGETLLYIISDILDMSHIDTGSFSLNEENYELGRLLKDLEVIVRNRAEEKGLELTIEATESLPNFLIGDNVRVRQVVLNILNNAVKYTRRGMVSMTVRGVDQTEDSVTLSFTVRDTGIGIKEEDLPYLFSKYQRVDSKKNRHIEGTGLGLSIVQSLTEEMHGRVRVDSVYGVGSVFVVELPQKIAKPGTLREYNERQEVERMQPRLGELMHRASGDVLVVDDNSMNRKMIRSLLLRVGLTVDTAESGQEALNLLRVNHYDIVLMDIMMPEMDGVETLHKLRLLPGCERETLPVIALTANATVGAREKYLAEGFDEYLTKPLNVSVLEETLQRMLPDSTEKGGEVDG